MKHVNLVSNLTTRARFGIAGLALFAVAISIAPPLSASETSTAPVQQANVKVTAEQIKEATEFWGKFRRAILTGDDKSLLQLIQLPLTVHGLTDFPPPRKVQGKQALKTIHRLLKQVVEPDGGGKRQTLQQLIQATPTLSSQHWVSTTMLDMDSLEFIKGKSGWKLVTVYDDDL